MVLTSGWINPIRFLSVWKLISSLPARHSTPVWSPLDNRGEIRIATVLEVQKTRPLASRTG